MIVRGKERKEIESTEPLVLVLLVIEQPIIDTHCLENKLPLPSWFLLKIETKFFGESPHEISDTKKKKKKKVIKG